MIPFVQPEKRGQMLSVQRAESFRVSPVGSTVRHYAAGTVVGPAAQ